MRKLILLFLYLNCASAANAADIDSLFEKSDLMITGYVLDQRVTNYPNIEEFIAYEFDFVIFSICASPERYPALLKQVLPGDTLKKITCLSSSAKDSVRIKQWYALPLIRDTLRTCGWRLTDQHYEKGIFGDSSLGYCPGETNYIFGEYGVVEQTTSHKGRWDYTTFTTLDSTIREQWKYRSSGDKWIEWRTEYSDSGQLLSKMRVVRKPIGWSSKQIYWIFRDNGRHRFRRTVWVTRV